MTAETQSSHWFSFGKKINLTLPVFDCRQKLSWLIFLLKLCWGTGWMSLSRTSIRHFGSLISLTLFLFFFCSSYWSTGFSIRWHTLSEFFSDRVKITICPLWWTIISVFYVILLKQMKPSNHQWKRQVKKNCKHHSKCMLGIHTASITAWQWLQCPPQEWSFTATDFFFFCCQDQLILVLCETLQTKGLVLEDHCDKDWWDQSKAT